MIFLKIVIKNAVPEKQNIRVQRTEIDTSGIIYYE